MKAKCTLYLGLVVAAGGSMLSLWPIIGLILEILGLFLLLLEAIKE